ncbi:MAG: rod shape-determining protein MreC [Prevotella sp.]|nr:rod shape-determining protein MreC [Prevotella sp.]MDY4667562.1 rod shape-determining protein MreC [Prevotella sp.]
MHNLSEFLSKNKHWFLLVLLEVASLVLLFHNNSYQGSVWFSSANEVAGRVLQAESHVRSFFGMAKINEELTQRNIYLEQQVRILTNKMSAKGDSASFLRLSRLQALSDVKLIPAKVVSNSLDKAENFITIDKGSADGVHKDMGVVCGTGIVGIVYLVSAHYSVVIPVLNVKSNISCAIKGRGYFGYLHWSGGACDVAWLDDVPRHAHFKLGSAIVTSGYSAVFPPGMLVGKVLHVYNSEDGLSYRLMVKLSTDFSRLRDVCVISTPHMSEQRVMLQAAQDSLKQKPNS